MPIAGTALKNTLATSYGTASTHVALFTASPGTPPAAANEVTGGSPAYARKPITFGAASGGVITGVVTFDVPAGTTVTFAGVCSSISGASVLDFAAVTSQNFATQGQYALTVTATIS